MVEPLVGVPVIENVDVEKEGPVDELEINQVQPSERIGFVDLPSEILFLILEPLQPVYERSGLMNGPHSHYEMARWGGKCDVDPVYTQDLLKFAELRLLCSDLENIISQIIYREVVIFINDGKKLGKLAAMFFRGADHIRSVVILVNRFFIAHRTTPSDTNLTLILAEGLRHCSNIQNLECFNNHHTFTNRKWLDTMAPNLASTLTSLVLYPSRSTFDLSHALVGLGRTIQTLEILQWEYPLDGSTFRVSAEMPQLSKLTLRGGRPPLNRVKKLFSRIRKKGTTNVSPLRSLALINVYFPYSQDYLDLLSINRVGVQLTSLRLYLGVPHMSFIPLIVKACPGLLEFSCTSEVTKSIFECLPPTLRYLELAVARDCRRAEFTARPEQHIPIFFDELTSYMNSKRAASLRGLSVHMKCCSPYSVDILPLNSVCTQLGVETHWHVNGLYVMFR